MANELKIGNKLVILNNAANLASLATDPVVATNGDMYYNSATNQFRVYQNGNWTDLQAGTSVTLAGQSLSAANIIVGNPSNLSAAMNTSALGDILAGTATGLTIKSDIITDAMVNSNAAITRSKFAAGNANRLAVNDASGVLSDAAAITTARALISDANGIPTHSAVTSAELAYLSGVNSSVQTQISAKVAKAGDTMTGNLLFSDTLGIDNAVALDTLNIGTTNAAVINIGHAGATVNILGSIEYVATTNLQVADTLITLNKGGAAASAMASGFEIEEDGVITAYFKTANSRASWDLKAPNTAGTVRFTPGALSIIIDQNLAVASSPTFVGSTLSGATASTVVIFNGSKALTSSVTTSTELSYLSGVTSAIQTQFTGKANLALSNLASVAINASLLPGGDNTIDVGGSSFNWATGHIRSIRSGSDLALNANDGSNNVNFRSNKVRRSKDGTNFVESEYIDATTLAANTVAATALTGFSFAFASYAGCIVEYIIKEASTNKTRIGKFIVSTDGTNVSSSDMFSETSALGNATGLSLDAAVNGSNIDIRFNNTHASNACTMRADIKRIRA